MREKFRVDIRNNLFSKRAVMRWDSCPGNRGSPPLEVLQNHGDVALRDVVMGTVGWVGIGVGDLGDLFQR